MEEKKINVVKIQRFSTHDGPGLRTTVFLKGCPLRCSWCHNPETQRCESEIFMNLGNCINCLSCASACKSSAHTVDNDGNHTFDRSKCTECLRCTEVCPASAIERVGTLMTAEEIISICLKDAAFYGETGGITLSGGEPMFNPENCLALLECAKKHGLHTAVETSGYFPEKYIPSLAKVIDLFIWDIKDGVPERHKKYIGADNKTIISNLYKTDLLNKKILLRCIMVKGVNMDHDNFSVIGSIYAKLHNCVGVELIPYHVFGESKSELLGRSDNGNLNWIPTESDMNDAKNALEELGCKIMFP